jgi:hypothetical protein
VLVGGTGTLVGVAVGTGVSVGTGASVDVGSGLRVEVGSGVSVFVGSGVRVAVAVGGTGVRVLVGTGVGGSGVLVGTGVFVGRGVLVGGGGTGVFVGSFFRATGAASAALFETSTPKITVSTSNKRPDQTNKPDITHPAGRAKPSTLQRGLPRAWAVLSTSVARNFDEVRSVSLL